MAKIQVKFGATEQLFAMLQAESKDTGESRSSIIRRRVYESYMRELIENEKQQESKDE